MLFPAVWTVLLFSGKDPLYILSPRQWKCRLFILIAAWIVNFCISLQWHLFTPLLVLPCWWNVKVVLILRPVWKKQKIHWVNPSSGIFNPFHGGGGGGGWYGYFLELHNVVRTWVTLFCSYHNYVEVFCDLLLNRHTATWNLFVKL